MRKLPLLALALAASSAAALTPVKIVTITSLSGPLSTLGNSTKLGGELAVRDHMAAMRALGFDLSLTTLDDGMKADLAMADAQKAVGDPSVLGVMGSIVSGMSIAASQVLAPAKLAQVSPLSTANEYTDRKLSTVNRVVARNGAQGAAMAAYAAQTLGAKKVFIVSDSTKYGDGLAADFQGATASNRLSVLGTVSTVKRSGFGELVKLIAAKKPDLIYYGGQWDGALGLLKDLRAAKVNTPFAGGDGLDTPEYFQTGKAAVRGTYYTTTFGPLNKFASAGAFTQRYRDAFGEAPTIHSLFAYDAMNVLLTAVENAARAGGKLPSREQVALAVRKVNLSSALTGQIQLDSQGDRVKAPLFIMKIDQESYLPDVEKISIVSR